MTKSTAPYVGRLVHLVIVFFFVATVGCRKEITQDDGVPNTKTVRQPETPEEIAIVESIKNLTGIMRKVLKNQDANHEIAAVIKGGYYSDERVKISDLLNYTQSPAYKTKSYKDLKEKNGIKEGSFKTEFQLQVPQSFLIKAPRYFDDLVLYFPYSEMFDLPRNYTLVAGVVETDEWEGWNILGDSETTCIVNDNFAYQKPVLIITSGAEANIIMDCSTNPAWCNDPLPDPPGLNVRRVSIGWMRTNDNFDRLIGFNKLNSGGNEINFRRTSGYLHFTERGRIKDFTGVVGLNFTRLDAKNKTWLPIYTSIDPNWKEDDLQQAFSCFELDGRGELKINGKLTTKVKVKVNVPGLGEVEVETNAEVQFEHVVVSEDQLFFSQPYTWNAYVGEVRNPIKPNELRPIRNNRAFNLLPIPGFPFINFSSGSTRDNRYLPTGEFWNIVNLSAERVSITWPYQIVR